MIINGIEFDFSTLNANDVDRMLAAQTRQYVLYHHSPLPSNFCGI